jgi:TM2 domain-containing membrane protein YozV
VVLLDINKFFLAVILLFFDIMIGPVIYAAYLAKLQSGLIAILESVALVLVEIGYYVWIELLSVQL